MKTQTREGVVASRKPLAGSFCNVKLHGDRSTAYTLGLGDRLEWPNVGNVVLIHGAERNGRFLVSSWEYKR